MSRHANKQDFQNATEVTSTLDAIKLMPGDALQLQSMLDGQQERMTVRVIGVMKPKSVLVTAPVIDGKLIFVREAQPFLVRAFSGLNVCAFKSKVLKAHHAPFPYLHLAYPETIQVMRIRKAVRAPVQLITAVYDKEGGRQIGAARIVDLSVGGARLYSPQPLEKTGATIFLSFKVKLDEIEEYIQASATIRAVGKEDDEEGKPVTVTGLQFGELQQSHKLIVMNLVYQYLLKENE